MFITIVFGSMVGYIYTILRAESFPILRFKSKEKLIKKANLAIDFLYTDEMEEKNTVFLLNQFHDNPENEGITVSDISSKINPNWVNKTLMKHLNEKMLPNQKLFKDEDKFGMVSFIQYQADFGLLPNIKHTYSDFFEEEIIDEYFTGYSYFNIMVTYPHLSAYIYAERAEGDPEDEDARQKFVDAMEKKYKELDPTQNTTGRLGEKLVGTTLESWFTKNFTRKAYDKVFPLLNAEPVMNIHFAPEAVIQGILSFDGYKLAGHRGKLEQIIEARETENGLTSLALLNILGSGNQYPTTLINDYFGVRTWFWEIQVKDETENTLTWIVARVPGKKTTDKAEYKLVKEEYDL